VGGSLSEECLERLMRFLERNNDILKPRIFVDIRSVSRHGAKNSSPACEYASLCFQKIHLFDNLHLQYSYI